MCVLFLLLPRNCGLPSFPLIQADPSPVPSPSGTNSGASSCASLVTVAARFRWSFHEIVRLPTGAIYDSILVYSFLFSSVLFYSLLFCSLLFSSVLFSSLLFYSILFYLSVNLAVRMCTVLYVVCTVYAYWSIYIYVCIQVIQMSNHVSCIAIWDVVWNSLLLHIFLQTGLLSDQLSLGL